MSPKLSTQRMLELLDDPAFQFAVAEFPDDHLDDEMRWWLAHEGVEMYYDGEDWLLSVATRCRNLKADNTCGIYETRFDTCRDYDASWCDYDTRHIDHTVHLRSTADYRRRVAANLLARFWKETTHP